MGRFPRGGTVRGQQPWRSRSPLCRFLIIVVGHQKLVPGKMARTFLKLLPARHLPFLYTVHRSSPSESFRSFPAIHTPAPPPPLPPVCLFSFLPVLAFSRRQILKSIEFPVGQTAKLPPNNLPWLVFQRSVESMRNTLRVVVACFIHKNVKCSSNKCLAVFSIYIAFFAPKKAHTK